jgi:hypothetical protein
MAGLETQDATLAAQIEVAAHAVTDLDRRLGQIDLAVEGPPSGRANAALSAMEGQCRARAGLAGERDEAAAPWQALKAERASVAARSRRIETEAVPVRYVAELVDADTDTERVPLWCSLATRWRLP